MNRPALDPGQVVQTLPGKRPRLLEHVALDAHRYTGLTDGTLRTRRPGKALQVLPQVLLAKTVAAQIEDQAIVRYATSPRPRKTEPSRSTAIHRSMVPFDELVSQEETSRVPPGCVQAAMVGYRRSPAVGPPECCSPAIALLDPARKGRGVLACWHAVLGHPADGRSGRERRA